MVGVEARSSAGRRVPRDWPGCTRTPSTPRRPRPHPPGNGEVNEAVHEARNQPAHGAAGPTRLLMMVEQLRRTASGGIGTYIGGLLQGLDALESRRAARARVVGQSTSGRPARPSTRLSVLGYPLRRSVATGADPDPDLGRRDPAGAGPASTWSTPPRCRPSSRVGRPWWRRCTTSCGDGFPRPTPPGGGRGTKAPCAGLCAGRIGSWCRRRWWPTTCAGPVPRPRPSPSSPWALTTCPLPTSSWPRPICPAWASPGPSC